MLALGERQSAVGRGALGGRHRSAGAQRAECALAADTVRLLRRRLRRRREWWRPGYGDQTGARRRGGGVEGVATASRVGPQRTGGGIDPRTWRGRGRKLRDRPRRDLSPAGTPCGPTAAASPARERWAIAGSQATSTIGWCRKGSNVALIVDATSKRVFTYYMGSYTSPGDSPLTLQHDAVYSQFILTDWRTGDVTHLPQFFDVLSGQAQAEDDARMARRRPGWQRVHL